MSELPGELVHLDVADGVATITLDSPDNRNALSATLRRELMAQLESAIPDAAARVIVLTHTGPVFCAGMDLKEPRSAGVEREFPAILERLWTSPTPVIAKLAGSARAGGVGMVAACDIAVAAADATFAFSEVRIGVVPAIISVTVLPRLAARAAHELFLTGETFEAARAVEIGLLNSAVPGFDLDVETHRYVEALRLGAPGALAATKELLLADRRGPMADRFAAMGRVSATFFAAQEGQEGMRAFVEKRRPSWAAGTSEP